MSKLTSQQLTELGDSFLAFAQAVGNYRMENRKSLTKEENEEIKDYHRRLLDYADDLFTTSAKLVIDDVQTSLDTIKDVTKEINETYHTLRSIQKAITVAAAGITLGAAIFSKSPQAIGKGVSGLVTAWKADEEKPQQ